MPERTVTIKLDLQDPANVGAKLLEVRQHMAALRGKSNVSLNIDTTGLENAKRAALDARKSLSAALGEMSKVKSNVSLNVDTKGLENARRAAQEARKSSSAALGDLSKLSSAVAGKAVAPLADYQKMLGSALQVSRTFGSVAMVALRSASVEFERQKTLAAFWGTSGYLNQGLHSFRGNMSSFLAGGASGFSGWLKSSSAAIAEYRTALVSASAVLVGFAAVAAMKSKTTQNLITSTLDTRLMGRKLTDKKGAEEWIQGAQKDDWSEGRTSRLGVFQTVLSKNKMFSQNQAQKSTEDIEKFFFANQEMLKNKGITSAEQLASKISAPELVGDDATNFEDIFGLGFSKLMPQARLARLGNEAKDIDIDKAMAARPDVIMSKRLEATTASIGDSVLPALNSVLGAFLDVSDAIGKIPGLGPMIGWGAVIGGAATGLLVLVGVLGSLIPGIMTVIGLFRGAAIAQMAMSAATTVAAAAQWLLNAAMTANPLGLAIVAVVGLVAVLYALEKKFGVVTKAWKMFSESSIGQGVFASIESGKKALSGLIGTLDAVYKKGGASGVIRMAIDALGLVSPMFAIVKVMLMVADFIRKIWVNGNILNKAFTTALAIWQKMQDFLNWLWSGITGMIKWLRDGLGITKAQEKEKLDKAAEKAGVTWDANKQQWYTTKSSVPASRPGSGVSAATLENLDKLKENVEKAPKTFFEQIPGFDTLTKAIEALTYAMQHPVAAAQEAANAAASSVGGAVAATAQPTMDADIANVNQQMATGQPVSSLSTDMGNPSGLVKIVYNGVSSLFGGVGEENGVTLPKERPDKATWVANQIKQNPALSQANAEAAYDFNYPEKPKMARGGQIKVTGSLIGHGGEEMDPARVVQGGETTLEKINKMFSGMSGDQMGGGQTIIVHAPPVSIHIDKVENNADIDRLLSKAGEEFDDKLLFRIRNKLDNTSLRGIGYMRG